MVAGDLWFFGIITEVMENSLKCIMGFLEVRSMKLIEGTNLQAVD